MASMEKRRPGQNIRLNDAAEPGRLPVSYGQGHRAPRGPLDEAMTGGPEIAQTTALGSAH